MEMTPMDDNEPPQGNGLISPSKNSKVTAIFSETILCRIGIHQGTWTTEGRQHRRFCWYCGRPQHKITRNVFPKLKCLLRMHDGVWTTDGLSGCWQRYRCKVCGVIIEQRYLGTMFSDAVYVFGATFSPAPSRGDVSEALPDGTKVSQSELVKWIVVAAFAYLYNNKLIDFVLEERKVLFRKEKRVYVKTLQATAPDLRGVEAVFFSSLRYNEYYGNGLTHLYGLTQAITTDQVLQIVKGNLLQRGILKKVVKEKRLFITTYKYVVNGDNSKEAKQVTELIKTLEELQSKGEIYQQMLSDIEVGMRRIDAHIDV